MAEVRPTPRHPGSGPAPPPVVTWATLSPPTAAGLATGRSPATRAIAGLLWDNLSQCNIQVNIQWQSFTVLLIADYWLCWLTTWYDTDVFFLQVYNTPAIISRPLESRCEDVPLDQVKTFNGDRSTFISQHHSPGLQYPTHTSGKTSDTGTVISKYLLLIW